MIPPWFRTPPHRTMREVDTTERIRARVRRGERLHPTDREYLAELEARAVEPERGVDPPHRG